MPIQIGSANAEGNGALNNIANILRSCIGWLGQAQDTSGRMRVTVDAGTLPTVTTVTTVSTVTSVTTLANQTQVGSFQAADQIPTLMAMTAQGIRSRIVVS